VITVWLAGGVAQRQPYCRHSRRSTWANCHKRIEGLFTCKW